MADDTKDLDEKNKQAPHVNPEKSGIRSGNPQLDPNHARKDRVKPLPAPRRGK
jgi:hypothetical protein